MNDIMSTTYIDAGLVGLVPKSPLLSPVSVIYAYIPSGENVIPVIWFTSIMSSRYATVLFQLTIRGREAISNNGQSSRVRIKPINLVSQPWLGTKMLPVAIHRISEVDVSVSWVDGNVVK